MEIIEFKNKEFKVREIDLPEFGNVLISTNSLNELLFNEEGSYISDEAVEVDEQIFYFVEENEIELPEEELVTLIIEQVT